MKTIVGINFRITGCFAWGAEVFQAATRCLISVEEFVFLESRNYSPLCRLIIFLYYYFLRH